MPGKKTGVFSIIRGVFRHKKDNCDDIVCQAESVISSYVGCRYDNMVYKYKLKNRVLNIMLFFAGGFGLYLLYRFLI